MLKIFLGSKLSSVYSKYFLNWKLTRKLSGLFLLFVTDKFLNALGWKRGKASQTTMGYYLPSFHISGQINLAHVLYETDWLYGIHKALVKAHQNTSALKGLICLTDLFILQVRLLNSYKVIWYLIEEFVICVLEIRILGWGSLIPRCILVKHLQSLRRILKNVYS